MDHQTHAAIHDRLVDWEATLDKFSNWVDRALVDGLENDLLRSLLRLVRLFGHLDQNFCYCCRTICINNSNLKNKA